MQIWAEPRKSALPICNYSQILYQFLTFTQNLKRSQPGCTFSVTVKVNMVITHQKGLFGAPFGVCLYFYWHRI